MDLNRRGFMSLFGKAAAALPFASRLKAEPAPHANSRFADLPKAPVGLHVYNPHSFPHQVNVRAVGAVTVGDMMIMSQDGYGATAAKENLDKAIGIALESANHDELVRCRIW